MNWINSLQLKKITVIHDTKQCYHKRSTRQSSQLNIPRCYRAVGQRSFPYQGVKLWSGITFLRSDLSNYLFPIKNEFEIASFISFIIFIL